MSFRVMPTLHEGGEEVKVVTSPNKYSSHIRDNDYMSDQESGCAYVSERVRDTPV